MIPEAASNVHKITTQRANDEGIPLMQALQEFSEAAKNSKILVAHNMSFDEKIMGAEFIRKEMDDPIECMDKVCTKEESTDFCRIPARRGYKWPTLTELHMFLFREGFEGAHDALADVTACAKCFFKLKGLNVIKK